MLVSYIEHKSKLGCIVIIFILLHSILDKYLSIAPIAKSLISLLLHAQITLLSSGSIDITSISSFQKDGSGGAQYYADRLVHEYPEFEARVTILGHLQRGGIPTAQDRILASRLGVAAIDALKDGQRNVMIGVKNDQIVYVPFNKAIRIDKPIDRELINVLNVLSI